MKFVLYEITEEFDIVIKLSFENESYLYSFIEEHTASKQYEPMFLVLEFDENNDIDFIFRFKGKELTSQKCVAEFIE
jgi:hypothetical protein